MYSKSLLPAILAVLAMLSAAAACPPGSVPAGDTCAFCPAGTYAVTDSVSCTPCGPGFWAPVNSVSSDTCYPIAAKNAQEFEPMTLKCDAGSAPKNGVCTFCPIGTYALAAAAKCTSCPRGYSAPINSASKDACYPLAAMMEEMAEMALKCDAGSAPKNGACMFCPVGSYALAGASKCSKCPAGYSAPLNSVSKDACYPLPAMESDEPHHDLRGFLVACDAGSAPVNGVCTFCPVGSYALAGAKCSKCPAGYSAPINSVSKDACYPLPLY